MSNQNQNQKPAEQKQEETENENEGGIPCPPGYTPNALDFRKGPGKRFIAARTEVLGKSITFTPLVESVGSCLMLFFMGGALVMAMNSMWTLIRNGTGAITAALVANHRLSWTNRLVMIAMGLGLLLFVLWRARAMGLIGPENNIVPPEHPPMFFERH